jgi:hypothetical protein
VSAIDWVLSKPIAHPRKNFASLDEVDLFICLISVYVCALHTVATECELAMTGKKTVACFQDHRKEERHGGVNGGKSY